MTTYLAINRRNSANKGCFLIDHGLGIIISAMRVPLTKYGWPQVVAFPAAVLATMVTCLLAGILFLPLWGIISVEVFLAVVLICVLMFFRDPDRSPPLDKNILLAPADGKITDIETGEENVFIGGAALKIGIFLSIFDAHINRAPCNVTVERITYKKGRYKNAMNPQSGRVNESNDLALVRTDSPTDRLVVRQISGAIARRIVCEAKQGQKLTGGERFGMIKFGSRTELYVPASDNIECLVKIGGKVKAGLTPLVKYEY
ncbi:MAG: phosphatidylserine decarboxylase [Planctomycetota bacterium]|jgi:phosphatidylserine decarboxylase